MKDLIRARGYPVLDRIRPRREAIRPSTGYASPSPWQAASPASIAFDFIPPPGIYPQDIRATTGAPL